MHKTNFDNAQPPSPACYKNFYECSGVAGDFKYYNQKKSCLLTENFSTPSLNIY